MFISPICILSVLIIIRVHRLFRLKNYLILFHINKLVMPASPPAGWLEWAGGQSAVSFDRRSTERSTELTPKSLAEGSGTKDLPLK